MDTYDSFISVNLCGTAHQRSIGLLGLRLIEGAGEVNVIDGFWQLDPLEVNVKVLTWTQDIDSLAPRIAKFMASYQKYASQEAVFTTYKDKDRYNAITVYEGEWNAWILEVSRAEYLIAYFEDRAKWDHIAAVYDGRDEYPAH